MVTWFLTRVSGPFGEERTQSFPPMNGPGKTESAHTKKKMKLDPYVTFDSKQVKKQS